MKILSLFTNSHVVHNLSDLLSTVEHKRRYFEKSLYPYNESQKNIGLY